MRSNLRLALTSAASGALLCGLTGMLIGAVMGSGTSIVLPGLGLVIAGSLALGIVGGLIGAVLGSMLGLLIAAISIILPADLTDKYLIGAFLIRADCLIRGRFFVFVTVVL